MWLFFPLLMRDSKNRIKKFRELVEQNKPDLIAVQEVWLNRQVKEIAKQLKGYFPLTIKGVPGHSGIRSKFVPFNWTGLAVFAKVKPSNTSIHLYPSIKRREGLHERYARKGFLEAVFDFDKLKLSLINTHLYDWRQYFRMSITTGQLKNMLSYSNDSDISLFCGDFNLSNVEVVNLAGGSFIHDGATEYTSVKENKYRQGRFYHFFNRALYDVKQNRKVDHILIKPNKNLFIKIKTIVIKEPLISDHYPLLATIEVKNS